LAGPIRQDASFYNFAYQIGRRANDLRSLLNTNAIGLQTSGIAPDSVARLLDILQRLGIPTVTGRLPSSRLGEQGSVFGSFDFAPQSSSGGQALNLSYNGSWNQQTPASSLTTELPAHSGDRTNWNAGLQGRHTNTLGSFTFNSLADLEAQQPSSFSRQLSPRTRSGSQFIGGLSLGDSYRKSDDLQVQYGVRLDGNRFSATPMFNPDLEAVFGERNDRAPNHVYASPRIGFSWSYGTAPQIAGFAG